jgi:hypothetical protein
MNVQASLYSTLLGEQFTDFNIYIYNVKLSPGKSLFCLFKYEEVSVLAPLKRYCPAGAKVGQN